MNSKTFKEEKRDLTTYEHILVENILNPEINIMIKRGNSGSFYGKLPQEKVEDLINLIIKEYN